MALSKTITLKSNFQTDVEFSDAYIKVENVKISKTFADALIYIFKSKDGQFLKSENVAYDYDINGLNPIAQTYNRLKSLPEFANSVDC